MLTTRTEVTRALAYASLFDGDAAAGTGLAGLAVHVERQSEITGVAIGIGEVSQGSATLLDGLRQDLLDGFRQVPVTRKTNAVTPPLRVDAGQEQGLVGVYVANAHHHLAVHDQILYRDPFAQGDSAQVITVESCAQGLRP